MDSDSNPFANSNPNPYKLFDPKSNPIQGRNQIQVQIHLLLNPNPNSNPFENSNPSPNPKKIFDPKSNPNQGKMKFLNLLNIKNTKEEY